MSTWCGALVEVGKHDLSTFAARHRLTIDAPLGPWALMVGEVSVAHIEPPRFAAELSAEIEGTVIAFMLQTGASCETLEHWERGELKRRLVCLDASFTTIEGTPQAWEATYFFDPAEGTADGKRWPLTLDDDIGEEDRLRYEEAKRVGEPSRVLDLIRGGSVWPMHRLVQHFGLDPKRPGARYSVPRSSKPWAVIVLVIALFAGSLALGALTR